MDALKQLKLAKNGYIVMSILFMILGICLIIWPDCSMAVFCTAVGIMLIAYGCIKIIGYFSRDFYCLAFQFDLAFGVLLAGCDHYCTEKSGGEPDLWNLWGSHTCGCAFQNPDVHRCQEIRIKSLVENLTDGDSHWCSGSITSDQAF